MRLLLVEDDVMVASGIKLGLMAQSGCFEVFSVSLNECFLALSEGLIDARLLVVQRPKGF